MLKIILLIAMLLSCNANADNENTNTLNYGASLYGLSYHTQDREKMNETNLGVALYATKSFDKHRFVAEIGTFENSFYDQAYWLGGNILTVYFPTSNLVL